MGKNIVHCGDSGTGQVAKVCNNLVLGISMIGVSEAMNLGVKLGIDPKKLAGINSTNFFNFKFFSRYTELSLFVFFSEKVITYQLSF